MLVPRAGGWFGGRGAEATLSGGSATRGACERGCLMREGEAVGAGASEEPEAAPRGRVAILHNAFAKQRRVAQPPTNHSAAFREISDHSWPSG